MSNGIGPLVRDEAHRLNAARHAGKEHGNAAAVHAAKVGADAAGVDRAELSAEALARFDALVARRAAKTAAPAPVQEPQASEPLPPADTTTSGDVASDADASDATSGAQLTGENSGTRSISILV